ncbi:hypothetical protein JUJ52_02480 [Virgibacillus sp. AGTR]|uniref:hypothetical protein n=1 Tax=Virgibacillus sp. AGTR TaxID=2812055 RepID=UPI001D163776|nr:hypothetical protein [Virgibacillus sp. AGTR]MCC2248825.1 hypothetical protein [Virgibacillus sp. AGTR]
MTGLLYSKNVDNILNLKHSKRYEAQHKNLSDRSYLGYTVIKLDEDVTFYIGWREDDMKEYKAFKGDYLVQTIMQPPEIIKTWYELRIKYKVFQNKKQSAATDYSNKKTLSKTV